MTILPDITDILNIIPNFALVNDRDDTLKYSLQHTPMGKC